MNNILINLQYESLTSYITVFLDVLPGGTAVRCMR